MYGRLIIYRLLGLRIAAGCCRGCAGRYTAVVDYHSLNGVHTSRKHALGHRSKQTVDTRLAGINTGENGKFDPSLNDDMVLICHDLKEGRTHIKALTLFINVFTLEIAVFIALVEHILMDVSKKLFVDRMIEFEFVMISHSHGFHLVFYLLRSTETIKSPFPSTRNFISKSPYSIP